MRTNKFRLSTKLIAYTALMTALTYVGTLLGFSGGQFYFNLGDSVILICAYLLGPIPAMIAGGLGAFLGDLTVYPATMLYTLVIKAIEGLVAGLMFMLLKKACAKYFAKQVSKRMKDYMTAHPEQTFADSSAPAAQQDLTGAPAPYESISATDLNHAPITSEATASDVAADILADKNAAKPRSADEAAPSDAAEKNDIYSTENDIQPQILANIKTLKKRMILLTVALSLPICVFSTALMAVGYFIAQAFIYGTYAAALIALPLDCVQAAISSAVATTVIAIFSYKSK